MKLSEIVEAEADEAEADYEEDGTVEEDLCEALELLEACLVQMEHIVRLPRGRRISAMAEKELIDLCLEVTGFVNQYENEEEA